MDKITITILCDNINGNKNGFKKDPGFSIAIKIENKIILFDTGMYKNNLLNNLSMANIKIKEIDAVILSHNHNDHTNGISAILYENPDIPVYIHKNWDKIVSFQGMNIPEKNRLRVNNYGTQNGLPANILFTDSFQSTDYGGIKEHAIIILLENSFILICGCCHPGLINFLNQRKMLKIDNKMPFHIFGGLHEFEFSYKEANELNPMIKSITLCHCTYNIKTFHKQFGNKCSLGIVGKKYIY